ncbi:MAG: bifunctional phosphopantothenoylcysteine decarboxylase/phosphopantothenate--cysteine ligase CoaBC [Myxococcota bacterium]
MESLVDKNALVMMGGGIAAYKAVLLVRELQRRGAKVRVAMSPSATKFVGTVTLAGLTGEPVATNLWDEAYPGEMHVELAAWADVIVVAPATMNLMARAAAGFADDVVLATLACRRCPAIMAPAMHTAMWQRASTQRNVRALTDEGITIVGPERGALANGEVGEGRMAEPEAIADAVLSCFLPSDYLGKYVVVSAGPTHEDIDPVRFIGNRSSGRMGFALARAARLRGAKVTLVAGPTHLRADPRIDRVDVRSAIDMHEAMRVAVGGDHQPDLVIMAAAVADYRPETRSPQKRKKQVGSTALPLVRNPDILQDLGISRAGKRPVLVGFALETENLIGSARTKLRLKKVDLIVANLAADALGSEENDAVLVSIADEVPLGRLSKTELAHRILDQALLRLIS